MKTQTIMVLGIIAAASLISVATFNENTSTQYAVASTQAPQVLTVVGHLEMVATDESGNIKSYVQTDNAIQEQGVNCIIQKLFATGAGSGNCAGDSGTFDVIQIGTGSSQPLSATTVATTTTNIASSGIVADPDGVTVNDTVTGSLVYSANGTVSVPFTATGTEAITEAILLNSTSAPQAALAYRNFTAINLENNDSLTVSWTISVLEG